MSGLVAVVTEPRPERGTPALKSEEMELESKEGMCGGSATSNFIRGNVPGFDVMYIENGPHRDQVREVRLVRQDDLDNIGVNNVLLCRWGNDELN